MPKLQAIDQPLPLAKMAYQALRDSIRTGHLKSGETYTEAALAKELQISRTPVREAFLELSAQGLVTFVPRRGILINHYTRGEVEEIFELRKAIELATVEKVAKASPPCDLHKIEKALNDQRKTFKKKDFLAFMEADRAFHTTFSELTNNQRFVTIVENIRDMIYVMGTQALAKEGRGEKVIAEHDRVLEAVRQGKPAQARTAMEDHLDQSNESVLRATQF